MAPRHWNEAFSVGNAQLDSEHRVLLGLINRLHEVGEDRDRTVQEVIESLLHYVEMHFRHEEALMRAADYPDLAVHQQHHDDFRADLAVFVLLARSDPRLALDRMTAFLEGWFQHHVLEEDGRYRPYLA